MSAKDTELEALRAQLAAAFNGGAPSSSDGHSSGTAGNQPHEGEVRKALTQSIVSPALSCPLLLHLLSMCPNFSYAEILVMKNFHFSALKDPPTLM